uniref:Uncharacterized protein n=1 Tax=Rhizophora mucronata TaxID=61149 RepID=A0A2P2PV74_RHIMU
MLSGQHVIFVKTHYLWVNLTINVYSKKFLPLVRSFGSRVGKYASYSK